MELGTPNVAAVGIAYASYVDTFLKEYPGAIDHIEVPFELVRHDPSVLAVRDSTPIVLHCASLSMAGSLACSEATVQHIREVVCSTATPWVGEHLAYITASALRQGAAGQVAEYEVGYTVSPPMNDATLELVEAAVARYRPRLGVPLILENSPMYFQPPASSMSQVEFVREVQARTDVGLLLDLTHLLITCQTLALDPLTVLDEWPLEAVVEIHVSGASEESGIWDDHARRAPEVVYRMLEHVLQRVMPQAITLEYNWSPNFPLAVLHQEVMKTRDHVASARARRQTTGSK